MSAGTNQATTPSQPQKQPKVQKTPGGQPSTPQKSARGGNANELPGKPSTPKMNAAQSPGGPNSATKKKTPQISAAAAQRASKLAEKAPESPDWSHVPSVTFDQFLDMNSDRTRQQEKEKEKKNQPQEATYTLSDPAILSFKVANN